MEPPPVKSAALELGLSVVQPEKVRDGWLEAWLTERAADVALVIAYGRILPPAVLAVPRVGCVNVHASILPRLRGAAPIQWAIMRGEAETGVSLMQMDEGLDTGPVFVARRIAIGPSENAGELGDRLAELAARTVREDLPRVVRGELTATPQNHAQASMAPPIEPDDARIHWTRTALDLANQVRGLAPRPAAFTTRNGARLRILAASADVDEPRLEPGQVSVNAGRILVGTGTHALSVERAQLEGKKPLAARDLVNGRAVVDGDVLGD